MSCSGSTDCGMILYQLMRFRIRIKVQVVFADGVEGDWDVLSSMPKKLDVVPNVYL